MRVKNKPSTTRKPRPSSIAEKKKSLKALADKKVIALNKLAKRISDIGYKLNFMSSLKGKLPVFKANIMKSDDSSKQEKESKNAANKEKKAGTHTTVPVFNTTLQKTQIWLNELADDANLSGPDEAYSALRAVLHTLRDRLLTDEAVHLGAQLPMLIRGFYYEGWDPSKTPQSERTSEEFLEIVRNHLKNANSHIDAKTAVKAVFILLDKKISEGEMNHVKSMLPPDIKDLWPDKCGNMQQTK